MAAVNHDTRVSASAAAPPQEGGETIRVRALLLGERLDTRSLEGADILAKAPAVIALDGGVAVLFRYGVVVLFGAGPEAVRDFLASIAPLVTEPYPAREEEHAQLVIRPDADQQIDAAGNIVLRERTIERLQLVADVLAKNLILGHYETRIAAIFDRIEPLAATLRKSGRAGARSKELLYHIGDVLAAQHQMVGRVETGEKPELLWEHPELERLYMRLAEEYELRDRDRALDRKLDVISRTVETLLGLVQTKSSARVEWYIVILIVAEIVLAAYSLLAHS
jgi:required for meiotic nuclear division protein 1